MKFSPRAWGSFAVACRIRLDASGEFEAGAVQFIGRGISVSVPADGEVHDVAVTRHWPGPLELHLDGRKILVYRPWWERALIRLRMTARAARWRLRWR